MRIEYNKGHSKFRAPIEQELERAGGKWPVAVTFDEPADYPRTVACHIEPGDEFETDWGERNPAWGKQSDLFPARIKAGTTALRDRKLFGEFLIVQDGQTLTILPETATPATQL